MTVKEFKEEAIPQFDYEITKDKYLLVQCYANKSTLSKVLVGIEKQSTEIKNAFKILKVGPNASYQVGDIVSVGDNFVDRPIVSYKYPEGNDPNKSARPVYGDILQGMFPFAFYCHKIEEPKTPMELTFLIPEDLVTIKHSI
jgi:hypothetical protein